MKTQFLAPLALALAFAAATLLAGCGGGATTGTLEIAVSGLPADADLQVEITGPGDYRQTLTAAGVLSNLTPGSYAVSAADVWVNDVRQRPDHPEQTVTVSAGKTSRLTLAYAGPQPPTAGELAWMDGAYNYAAWSNDGSKVFISQSHRLLVVDGASGESLDHFGEDSPQRLSGLAVSPDDDRLAVVSGSEIQVWNYTSKTLLHTLSDHDEWIWQLAWSPDGEMIASASVDNKVIVWDADTGAKLHTFSDHDDAATSVSWSSDSRYLASGGVDSKIFVWDTQSWALEKTITANTGVYSVAFSPDDQKLAAGDRDGYLNVWDYETGTLQTRADNDDGSIKAISWSPDGNGHLACGGDSLIRIWSDSGTILRTINTGRDGSIHTAAWSPDGGHLLEAGNRIVRSWDATASDAVDWALIGAYGGYGRPAWSPDGRRIAVGSGELWLLDPTSGKASGRFEDAGFSAAWSPDGSRVASNDWNLIKIFNVASESLERSLSGHSEVVTTLSWSPTGDAIASGSLDKTVRLWDPEGHWIRNTDPAESHGNSVNAVSWSPDGRLLASGSDDDQLKIWSAADGVLQKTISHAYDVHGVAWSPGGGRLASASREGVKVWDAGSGDLLATLGYGINWHYYEAAWSPGGAYLAAAGHQVDGTWGSLEVYDAASGELLLLLRGSSYTFAHVAWSPDGRALVASSNDFGLYLYQLSY